MPRHGSRWTVIAVSMFIGAIAAPPTEAQTLDRIRSTSSLKLGYEPDSRPFSFKADQGTPNGYAVALCNKIADGLKHELSLPQLNVEWIPLNADARARAVPDGTVDLVCGAEPITLTRRKDVSFSLPIFPSGTGVVISKNAPLALSEVLAYGEPTSRPIWRGSPARTILEQKTFSSIAGTTSERWLTDKIKTFQLAAASVAVDNYQLGIERVLDGSSAALFGDMPLLMDAVERSHDTGNLRVLRRHFTYEPLGLELARGDEDFRLSIDRVLSQTYASPDFPQLFMTWFGPPDETMVTFFRQTALPQ
jgi:polar amino acid transport system substrate-binding protein